jgi:hypothetical protein
LAASSFGKNDAPGVGAGRQGLVSRMAPDAQITRPCADLAALRDATTFKAYLAPLQKSEWVVYAKRPFAGPKQVLAYLARYTHRVAMGNSRLLKIDNTHVSFRWKDYRENGNPKSKVMSLPVGEFIRRFLLHVLPDGFHRIRHFGLFANGHRANKLVLCQTLLGLHPGAADSSQAETATTAADGEPPSCPCCGGRMRVIETFDGPYSRPYQVRRFDSS